MRFYLMSKDICSVVFGEANPKKYINKPSPAMEIILFNTGAHMYEQKNVWHLVPVRTKRKVRRKIFEASTKMRKQLQGFPTGRHVISKH